MLPSCRPFWLASLLLPDLGQFAFPFFPFWHCGLAISRDFKKQLGPQLCHGPSLVLQHLKHTHSLSLDAC